MLDAMQINSREIFGKTDADILQVQTRNGNVIGLSKINRLVEYYAKRPQVQERLNEQIARALKEVLKTDDVAVVIDAEHLCVKSRGIQDTASSTVTASYHGKFKEMETRKEFLSYLNLKSQY